MDFMIVISPVLGWIIPTALGALCTWLGIRVKHLKAKSDTIDQIALMTCRQVIYSDVFDIEEKIEAYILYRSKGGNHRTKRKMSELVGEDIDEYLKNHKAAQN